MIRNTKAIIFDMDGVIIDSEKFWKQAEYEVFTSLGVKVTNTDSKKTQSMTTHEVTQFWYQKYPWKNKDLKTVEQMVISRVIELIETEDCQINGVISFIKKLKDNGYKIGLATNSPHKIIPVVLKKLNILSHFDSLLSAEFEQKGKPDPAIYRKSAEKLKTKPEDCTVIEDSYTGMIAAKKAGMKVIAFTNGKTDQNYKIADIIIDSFENNEIEEIQRCFI